MPKYETPVIHPDTLKDAAHYRNRGNMVMAEILHKLGATRAWLDATSLVRERVCNQSRLMILDGESRAAADAYYRDEMARLNRECDVFCAETWAEFSGKVPA